MGLGDITSGIGETICSSCGMAAPPGMRFCGHCGAPLRAGRVDAPPAPAAPAAPVRVGTQRRHMTALFCDLVGSTPLAEWLDPEDFHQVLTEYQQTCVRAIERMGGYTARYVGDGVIAYFGYPRAHEDDAQRAVHAGLGIVEGIAALNPSLGDAYGVTIAVRIGLHSGMVVAGEMDAGERAAQLEIVGEMPNIAARIESIAPRDSVTISDATADLVSGYFELEPLGEKTLKGVSRPVALHRVIRPTGAVARLEVAAGPLTPVIDRVEELSRLREAWEHVREGQGAVVHLSGEAGIGKSRLARAFREAVEEDLGAVHTWQCSAHHGMTALYPVARQLEGLIDRDGGQPDEARWAGLRQKLTEVGVDPEEGIPLLANLIARDAGSGQGVTADDPLQARNATMRVLEALLVHNPAHHPLLLMVEDLHWADPTTLELMERVVGAVPGLPVLCLISFRREFQPPWIGRVEAIELALGPLSSEEVRQMVAAATGGEPDPEVIEQVDSAADGVPLFVEEMLKMQRLAGHASGDPSGAPIVPPTLEGLLTERLDRLPDLTDVIDAGAVIGREFPRDLLATLVEITGAELDTALATLVSQGILRPASGAGDRFEFTHALLQEAAYERLMRRRRRMLHARVATALSQGTADELDREPELVARHFSAAGDPARAVEYWGAAGARALERGAFREAAEHFRRGLEELRAARPSERAGAAAADTPEAEGLRRADFLTHRAAALQAADGYAAAGVAEAYAAARPAYVRGGHDDRLVGVIRGQWMLNLLKGQYAEARERAREMLVMAERGARERCLAEGHLYLGLVEMYQAEFVSARRNLEEALRHYRRPERGDQIYVTLGDTAVGSLAYNAVVLWNLGHAPEATESSDRSLQLAEELGGLVTRAQAWGMRSMLHLNRAEPAEFQAWVDRTRTHSLEHNIGYWTIFSSLFAGWIKGRSGDLASGIERVQESLDAYIASGSTLGLSHFYVLLADLLLAAGQQRRALDALLAGEEYIAATGERFSESELFRFKTRTLMTGPAPDPEAATVACERAAAVARAQGAKLLELRAVTQLVALRRELGERNGADELRVLCDWFASTPALPDVIRARALLSTASAAP